MSDSRVSRQLFQTLRPNNTCYTLVEKVLQDEQMRNLKATHEQIQHIIDICPLQRFETSVDKLYVRIREKHE